MPTMCTRRNYFSVTIAIEIRQYFIVFVSRTRVKFSKGTIGLSRCMKGEQTVCTAESTGDRSSLPMGY